MVIFEQIIGVCKDKVGEVFTSQEIKFFLSEKYNTNASSVIPSDYCYNRINKGIIFTNHLFLRLSHSKYEYVGENYPYSGEIYWKEKKAKNDVIVGKWENGESYFYTDEFIKETIKKDDTKLDKSVSSLDKKGINKLYDHYIKILEIEINELGVKPTEVRHLIGRIGEFKCAIETNGRLAHVVNQHGFDVISNNKKISVKTTAQKSGFISINKKTLHNVDELMILQYEDNEFKIVYYGEISQAISVSRLWEGKYELDISKARKLSS